MKTNPSNNQCLEKRLLFIPSYFYLSNPLYIRIAEISKSNFYNIYLNTNDPIFSKSNESDIKKDVLKIFEEYRSIDYVPRPLGIDKVKGFLVKFKAISFFIIQLINLKIKLEKDLKALRPDAIIATSDLEGYVNRMCNLWAEKNDIPFIVLQPSFMDMSAHSKPLLNGPLSQVSYKIFKLLGIPLFRKQSLFGNERENNFVFLYSNYFKNYYDGIKAEEKIRIIGNPKFDPIFSENRTYKVDKTNKEKRTPSVAICTEFLEGILPDNKVDEINNIYKYAIGDNKDIHFTIKLHPREDEEKYKEIFGNLKTDNFEIVKDINLYELIKRSDVQVSMASYSSFEAVALGVPIVLVCSETLKGIDYFNHEIELRANTPEELSRQLRRAVTAQYRKEFLERRIQFLKSRLGYIDSKSTERVVKNIKEIINSKEN